MQGTRLPFSVIIPSDIGCNIKKKDVLEWLWDHSSEFFLVIICIVSIMWEMGSTYLASSAFVIALTFFLLSHLAFHSSDATHPECGLSTIYCKHEKPMVNSTVGKPYEVTFIEEDSNIIVIRDVQLHESLHRGDCSGLYDFQTPFFPTHSHEVMTPNIAMFKCENYFNFSQDIYRRFGVYSNCSDRSLLFYGNSKQSIPHALVPAHAPAPLPDPNNCSLFHFPVQPPFHGNWSDTLLLPLLEKGIILEWRYPSKCHDCGTKRRSERSEARIKCTNTKHGTVN